LPTKILKLYKISVCVYVSFEKSKLMCQYTQMANKLCTTSD